MRTERTGAAPIALQAAAAQCQWATAKGQYRIRRSRQHRGMNGTTACGTERSSCATWMHPSGDMPHVLSSFLPKSWNSSITQRIDCGSRAACGSTAADGGRQQGGGRVVHSGPTCRSAARCAAASASALLQQASQTNAAGALLRLSFGGRSKGPDALHERR